MPVGRWPDEFVMVLEMRTDPKDTESIYLAPPDIHGPNKSILITVSKRHRTFCLIRVYDFKFDFD